MNVLYFAEIEVPSVGFLRVPVKFIVVLKTSLYVKEITGLNQRQERKKEMTENLKPEKGKE